MDDLSKTPKFEKGRESKSGRERERERGKEEREREIERERERERERQREIESDRERLRHTPPPADAPARQPLVPTPAPRGLTTDLDREAYEKFVTEIVQERHTTSVLEMRLLMDFATCEWQVLRLTHWEEQIIRSLAPRTLATLLDDCGVEPARRDALVRSWAQADPAAVADVRDLLEAAGLATTAIDARTYFDRLPDFMKLGKMITQARKARDAAFRALTAFREQSRRAGLEHEREYRQRQREIEEDQRKEKALLLRGTRDVLKSG